MNILFVCTGNAAVVLWQEGDYTGPCSRQHKDVTTVSAGLFAAYGAKPAERSRCSCPFHC